jgi:hypothetical protein
MISLIDERRRYFLEKLLFNIVDSFFRHPQPIDPSGVGCGKSMTMCCSYHKRHPVGKKHPR